MSLPLITSRERKREREEEKHWWKVVELGVACTTHPCKLCPGRGLIFGEVIPVEKAGGVKRTPIAAGFVAWEVFC